MPGPGDMGFEAGTSVTGAGSGMRGRVPVCPTSFSQDTEFRRMLEERETTRRANLFNHDNSIFSEIFFNGDAQKRPVASGFFKGNEK